MIPEESNKLIDLLLIKMKNFGINYKISKNTNEPKQGIIPSVDIETLENSIVEQENIIKDKPNGVNIEYLQELLQKAVEYFSAVNNFEKCEEYKKKIQTLMNSESLIKLVDEEKTKKCLNIEISESIPSNEEIGNPKCITNNEEEVDSISENNEIEIPKPKEMSETNQEFKIQDEDSDE